MGAFAAPFAFPFGGDDEVAADPVSFALGMEIEEGATVEFSWLTAVREMWSGVETRAALISAPRQRFEFTSALSDAAYREVTGALAGSSASAQPFLLDLAHEDTVIAGSTSADVTLHDAQYVDWAVSGQRVVVVAPTGERAYTTITGAAVGDTIPTADDVSALAVDGARLMPVLQVQLDPDQQLAHQRVAFRRWSISASAIENGYGASIELGVGATVNTYDGLPVWDRGNVTSQADQALISDISQIDAGLGISAIQLRTLPFWRRSMRIESSELPEWQWFKKFLATVQGRARAFLLPSHRPDMVAESDASSGTLTISGADYAGVWAASTAHRRIRILFTDGTYAYRGVTSSADNGDGTQDLTLSSAAAGTIARIELLETVRLESDTVTVRFRGFAFESSLTVKVIQQVAETAPVTYDDYERSKEAGKPRELYTFLLFGETYRLTSSKQDETYASDTYTATPGLSRGNVVESPLGEKRDLNVTLPITHAIAQALLGNGIPPRDATLTIFRLHEASATYQVWVGGIAEVSTDDQYARLRVPSLLELAFDISLPIAKASRLCQHALYSPGCGLEYPTLLPLVTVLSVSTDGTDITLDDTWPDGQYNGGEITRTVDGETRTILEQVGPVITVDVPFRSIAALDTATVVRGCDGQITTCRDVFDNVPNFGGHPDLPEVNPATAQPAKGRSLWDVLKGGG